MFVGTLMHVWLAIKWKEAVDSDQDHKLSLVMNNGSLSKAYKQAQETTKLKNSARF